MIIVKNTDMPEGCGRCPFRHRGRLGIYYCMAMGKVVDDQLHEYEDERHPDCPLEPFEEDDGR